MVECLLHVKGRFAYEVTAQVLAIFAFPEATEARMRELADLLCLWYADELFHRADRLKFDPRPHLNPEHARPAPREIGKFIQQMNYRLRQRALAGHVAIAILQEAAPGEPHHTPEDLGERTVENVMLWYLRHEGGDEANFKKRRWRPSQCVIHLAAAWAVKNQDCERNGLEPPGIFDLMHSVDNLVQLLDEACAYEAHVAAASRLKLANENMIRFRLVA